MGAGGVSPGNVVVSFFSILESHTSESEHKEMVSVESQHPGSIIGALIVAVIGRVIWPPWKRRKELAQADGECAGIARRPMVSLKRHVKPEEMPQFRDDVPQVFQRLVRA